MATSSTSPIPPQQVYPRVHPNNIIFATRFRSQPPRTRSETAVLQASTRPLRPEIKAFAECAVNRTVTATWICRQQRLAMNSCMVAHAKPEEEDRAREEWFAGYEERRRAKEEDLARVEKRREEVIRMMREDEARARAAGK